MNVLTLSRQYSKIYLAFALGHPPCHQGYRVRYYRATRLFEALTISHGDGNYIKLLAQIAKVDILIIDDWGLDPLSQSQKMIY